MKSGEGEGAHLATCDLFLACLKALLRGILRFWRRGKVPPIAPNRSG
jgi:hypothetical protein